MRSEQARGNRRGIGARQSERGRVHDEIGIGNLEAQRRLVRGDRLQAGHRSQNSRTGKKGAQFFREPLRFFQIAIGDHEALAVFFRALEGDRARGAAGAKHQDAQVAKIDGEFLPNRAGESFAVGIEPAQFAALDFDGVDSADLARGLIRLVDQSQRRDLVRDGQVYAHKIEARQQFERGLQFARRDLESGVAHLEAGFLQGGVLHLGRERMRDRMAEDAETNRRLEFLAAETLKVGERVNFFHGVSRYCLKEGRFETALFKDGGCKPPLLEVCRSCRASATVRARR